MSELLERFLPTADVRERHQTLVRSPAGLVFEVAEHVELQSIFLVRALFWLRAKLMGAHFERSSQPLVEDMLAMGWEKLAFTPGRELVMGSATQPCIPDVKFRTIPSAAFAAFEEPSMVKLAWTLEVEPLGRALTRCQPRPARKPATPTRARSSSRNGESS
jgi:hypothetical protein